MKRLRGAPDLRNTEKTAEAICSLIDKMFIDRDRLAVKVYCLQSLANMTSGKALGFLGVRSNNHTNFELEVERKSKTREAYRADLSAVLTAFGKSIPKSRKREFKTHLKQIHDRL